MPLDLLQEQQLLVSSISIDNCYLVSVSISISVSNSISSSSSSSSVSMIVFVSALLV